MSTTLVNLTKMRPKIIPENQLLNTEDECKILSVLSTEFPEYRTELGFSRRLVRENLGDILYSHTMGTWFLWADGYWRIDTMNEVMQRAQKSITSMYLEAAQMEGPSRLSAINHAMSFENKGRLQAVIALAHDDPRVRLDYHLLDADPLLVGVQNGVIDLRTGEFRQGLREDLITKRCNVVYDPDATCPNWMKFLERISGMHAGLIEYKQKAFGLLLCALVCELLFIAHGCGANGKTTELETLADILGDYAHAADASLLVTRKEAGGPSPEIVILMGKRAVFINETGEKDWLNESRVKFLTGTDTMSGRNLHEGIVNWKPTHKPWLRTNHKPKIRGTDEGMWRRVQYIPYTAVIPKAERNTTFREEYLYPEKAGILNWMLAGWMKYLADGKHLNEPPCVLEACKDYKEESDITGHWIATRLLKASEDVRLSLKDAHTDYVNCYQDEIGEKFNIQKQALSKALVGAGFIKKKGHGGLTYFAGVTLQISETGLYTGLDIPLSQRTSI
jgi:putative DNA primase/helicase